ncbi:hypothetical protein ACKI1Q_42840 [Streptomyces galilaeus]
MRGTGRRERERGREWGRGESALLPGADAVLETNDELAGRTAEAAVGA